jgi:DNA polymerase V
LKKSAGIFDNDILVVDPGSPRRHNHVVVAIVDGDLTVKYLTSAGRIKLRTANPTFRHLAQRRSDH